MEYAIADLKKDLNGSEWSITARVLTKSKIYLDADAPFFTIILFDKTTEISATAINKHADRLFSQLQENNVYNIKNGKITLWMKRDNNKRSNNDYEILFDDSTIIEWTGVTDIPIHPQLKTIENVFSMGRNPRRSTYIDTIGVIIQIEPTHTITYITLADRTSRVIVRLYPTHATNFKANKGDVMSIIRGEIVFNKLIKENIWVEGCSKIVINPDWKVHITSYLQSWYKEIEKKEDLNLSQVSIGSEELNTLKYLKVIDRNQTINEPTLQQNQIDDALISKRLLELNDEEHKIKTERADLNFKKQRLLIERENIKSRSEN